MLFLSKSMVRETNNGLVLISDILKKQKEFYVSGKLVSAMECMQDILCTLETKGRVEITVAEKEPDPELKFIYKRGAK